MSVDYTRFKAAFFEESAEHAATMEEGLLRLERQPGDLDLLNRIFRAAHSIKGNAGMFGFTAISAFTHTLENILDALRNGRTEAAKPLIDLLLEATDGLKGLLDAARTDAPPDDAVVGPLRERLQACLAEGGAPGPAHDASCEGRAAGDGRRVGRYEIVWAPTPTVFARGLHPAQIIRELRDLGPVASAADLDRLPSIEELAANPEPPRWTFVLETDRPRQEVEDVFLFVRDEGELEIRDTPGSDGEGRATNDERRAPGDAPTPLGEILLDDGVVTGEALAGALAQQKRLGQILIEQRAATPEQIAQALDKQRKQEQAKRADGATIRVDTEKIDKLINLVGELVITQSMLSDLGARFTSEKLPLLQERLVQLERNTREIQERVMAVRMLPIGTAFQRFPRLVRDLAGKSGKQIHLQMSGEETELDKTVIESIGDPLTHLVRNSADHGLEPPEERRAAGKPEQGTITLNAFHEGGSICITVGDDGRGLNREKILAKAVTQGLIAETDRPTDEQVWPLIFRPGFSTADRITDVSGRGVGMDVVKRNIEALGGTIGITTSAGRGTTFTLKLPLTLAIIEGMTVRVGPEAYIVPLISIVESIKPQASTVRTIAGRGEVVTVRGAHCPVLRLSEVFGIRSDCIDAAEAILVIIETEGERVALMVDELLGQQQVVIKNLEQNFRKVDGVAGATILGDGTVALILDVRGLIEVARGGPVAV